MFLCLYLFQFHLFTANKLKARKLKMIIENFSNAIAYFHQAIMSNFEETKIVSGPCIIKLFTTVINS
jgi:hypothetical protein